MSLRIHIATPVAVDSLRGNGVTARRWCKRLEELGHHVTLGAANGDPRDAAADDRRDGDACDVLIALHATRSHPLVARHRAEQRDAPVVVALTGTDLYLDLPHDADARRSLELADRVVALHDHAVDALPADLRPAIAAKMRTIHQSCEPPSERAQPDWERFEIAVVAHLREVKDPFRAALAARRLPRESRVVVVHAGEALEPGMAEQARREQAREQAVEPRYRWLGPLPGDAALALLARSRATVVSSRHEGGANTISEAVVCGVPILCSDAPGNLGLLGADHPGRYAFGDTGALALLMHRVETDDGFRAELQARCERLAPRFAPAAEREAWRVLLAELIA